MSQVNWISSSPQHLQVAYANLLESGMSSDAKVRCATRTWDVHKSILCVRSDWFKTALMGGFQETRTSVVTLTGWLENEVGLLLHYIYTGAVDVDKYLPDASPLMAVVKVWEIADFFCMPDLTRASLEARDRFFKSTTRFYCAVYRQPMQAANIDTIVEDLRALYSMDRDDISDTFRLPYVAVLLLGIRFFAKEEAFKTLILEEPEFAQDWALGMTKGIGSTVVPVDAGACEPFCVQCGQHVGDPSGNFLMWAKENLTLVFCTDCIPTPTWQDWTA